MRAADGTQTELQQPTRIRLMVSHQPAASEWHIPPPPYSATEVPIAQAGSDRTESLRRFLSFCLAVDYECLEPLPERLSKSELMHWEAISQLCFRIFSHAQPRSRFPLIRWPKGFTHPQIEEYILKPASSLGVPSVIVFLMTRIFMTALDKSYKHTLEEISLGYGYDVLAYRIYTDRVYLFDRVLPSDLGYRELMERSNLRAQGLWFETLGPRKFRRHLQSPMTSLRDHVFSHLVFGALWLLPFIPGAVIMAHTRRLYDRVDKSLSPCATASEHTKLSSKRREQEGLQILEPGQGCGTGLGEAAQSEHESPA